MKTIGDKLEAFTVTAAKPGFNHHEENGVSAFEEITEQSFPGKWKIIYFYPKDFTQGCTIEARNFQRDIAKYEAVNAVILGVSVDNEQSHKDFCAKEGLNFKLLADTEAKVSEQYGSVMEYNGAKLSARNTFIIDPQGKVVKVFEKVKVAAHS